MVSRFSQVGMLALVAMVLLACEGGAFSPLSRGGVASVSHRHQLRPLRAATDEDSKTEPESNEKEAKISLEEKMKNWEASEEEVRAATLGGVVPDRERADAFDVGLYIAFPIMVATGLLFAFFPLIMGNIDASSVGPPPTS